MAKQSSAIAALERVLITVEAELTALHTGAELDRVKLDEQLRTELTTQSPQALRPVPQALRPVPQAPAPVWPAPVAGQPLPPPPNPPTQPNPPTLPPPPPGPPLGSEPAPLAPTSSGGLEQIFRLGGISLVVLAAVFFVSTAISRGWIGPTGQLIGAATVSLLIIGQSFRFAENLRPWKKTFAIGGAAALFVTGVIGHFGLDLLDINATLGWLGATVIGFLVLGRAHDSETVAAAGGPAAMLGTAIFAATGDAPGLIVAGLGICWGLAGLAATHQKQWYIGRAVAGITTGFIVFVGLSLDAASTSSIVAGLLGIATVVGYAMVQVCEYGRGEDADELPSPFAQIEARIAAVTTPWAVLMMSILIAGDIALLDSNSQVIGAFAVGTGIAVTLLTTLFAKHIHPTMAMLHQLAGTGTATVGFITILDGPILVAALLSQAILTGAFAYRTRAAEMVIGATLLTGVTGIWAAAQVISALTVRPMDLGEIIVSGLVLATFGAASYVVRHTAGVERAWVLVWGGYLTWVVAAFQAVPQAQMAISLAWAASAVALLAIPRMTRNNISTSTFRYVLNVALGTFLLTGAKLIFVDLVTVDVLWRAALFAAIGATFLRLAFVLPEIGIASDPNNDDGMGENGSFGPENPPETGSREPSTV